MLQLANGKQQFLDQNGAPLASGLVYHYAPGTTDPATTYKDSAGTSTNTNPIQLDSRGQAVIWGTGTFRQVVTDQSGVLVWDQVVSAPDVNAPANNLAAQFLSALGSALMGFIQAGVGAIKRTVQDELRDTVRVSQFGAVPNTGTDQGPKIAAAHAYAQSINADLEFPGGVYTIGPGTSFTVDPQKTRWVAKGPVGLRWSAAPTSGVAVTIVAGETAAYETVRTMVGAILSGIDILGSPSSGVLFNATGLRIGDGTHQTNALSIEHATISGWSNVLDYTDNVWWIRMEGCRLLWGTITTPTASGNWGESNTFDDCVLADGLTMTINYGEWKFYGRSLDNGQIVLKNNAYLNWHGGHIENPGQTTLTRNFIRVEGSEATCHLISPQMLTNNDGSAITVAPFYVSPTNTRNGLILDGLQYTQGGFAKWYSMVDGGGKVTIRSPQILAFSNFNFQVIAENARGQLRNYGFEAGDMSGWTVTTNNANGTSTATVGSARVRPGSTGTKSCLLTVTKTALGINSGYGDITLSQKQTIQGGELLQIRAAINRQYTSAPGAYQCILSWLDLDGNVIYPTNMGYLSAATSTDDGTAFNTYSYNDVAPAGTAQVQIAFQFMSPTAIGTANLTIDDVFVNVIA